MGKKAILFISAEIIFTLFSVTSIDVIMEELVVYLDEWMILIWKQRVFRRFRD